MSNVVLFRESFSTYGLNKYRNFLEEKRVVTDDIMQWAADKLEENGCIESAVFIIDNSNNMSFVHTEIDEEEEAINVIGHDIGFLDPDAFAMIDSELRLCCYGLVEESKPGIWKVFQE